ncbi:MAG: sigma-70 family RNA polymerase sigma factor [Actinomycetota bacterium]
MSLLSPATLETAERTERVATTLPAGAQEVKEAQDRLILDHLDLVGHLVGRVSSRYPQHVDRAELYNAGACGLVEAARRYNPDTDVPFARYAGIRIRGAIIDSSRSRDWVARSVRRGIRELRQEEEAFEAEAGRAPTDAELAARMGIPLERLREHRESVVTTSLLHLDYAYPDREALHAAFPESDPGLLPEESLEQRELFGTLRTTMDFLPPSQAEVIRRYYFGSELLLDIARSMGVTEARVSQICTEALNSIRASFGRLYDGVPEVADSAPGKRARASHVAAVTGYSTWRDRLDRGAAGAPARPGPDSPGSPGTRRYADPGSGGGSIQAGPSA